MIVESSELFSRGSVVANMLRPLHHSQHGPAHSNSSIGGSAIIGTHDVRVSAHHRDWRFNTISKTHKAAYFEEWIDVDRGRKFELKHAALNLYTVAPRTFEETEFLLVHCEPANVHNGVRYKVGPHLHISCAPSPVRDAHIALCPLSVEQAIESSMKLTAILAEIAIMIREEVFNSPWTGPAAEALAH